MALPPADELSRWTVAQVNVWLTENSLTAFREAFLTDCIDGSKLMRLTASDIDKRYASVPFKKRRILKDILSKVESSPRPAPTWNSPPPKLPPRPTQTPHVPSPTESDDDEGGWSDSFEEDEEDPGDYVEPTAQPSSGACFVSVNKNASCKSEVMEELEVYEQVDEDVQNAGPDRKSSLLSKLKTALDQRSTMLSQEKQDSDSDGESYLEPVSGPDPEEMPPPRPPRLRETPGPTSGGPVPKPTPGPPLGALRRPPPLPKEPKGTDDVYEVMEDAADSVNGDEEYVEPDVPSPPEIAVEKKLPAGRGKVPPVSTPVKSPYKGEPPAQAPKNLCKVEPAPVKDTSVVPPWPGQIKKSKTPPSGGWLFQHAKPTQASYKHDDLSSYSWFHGNIRREDAEGIFEREHMEGMFLIRKSERKADQPYTLVLWHDGRMWNLPVRLREDKKYAAGSRKEDESAFDSIVELVEHFKIRGLNLKSGDEGKTTVTLRQAAPKH